MKNCPECKAFVDGLTCHKCGYTEDTVAAKPRSDKSRSVDDIRGSYLSRNFPRSDSLTPQQWYNVCKFYPDVAQRSERAMYVVGKDQSLDATSKKTYADGKDPKQWARDVLEMASRGQYKLPVGIEFARYALRNEPVAMREPGEEG
jgi:hypothetical protein